MSEETVSLLYTYMAIASFISRHLFCKLGDSPYLNRFYLYQGGITISGLCIICIPAAGSFLSILIPLMGFALMDGAVSGQQSLLVLECVGHHMVNRAWGYIMLFAGISASVGPPLVGLMADKLGSYVIPFYAAGVVLIAGASITSLMTCVKQQSREIDCRIVQSEVEELSVAVKETVL